MSNLTLVNATLADLELIVAHDKDVNQTPWKYNDYLDSYNNSCHNIVCLVDNNIIVGSMTYSLIEDEAEILQLFIIKDYQKQGYAEQLIKLFINQICMPHKITQVLLEVRDDNIGAKHLYDKLGFIEAYTRKNYYKCGNKLIDAQIMLKPIIC